MRKINVLLLLLFLVSSKILGQQEDLTITGKVTDENGEALPGANVLIKGTINGTITDLDGNYTITPEYDHGVLVFSFVGMIPQEMPIGNQDVINIALQPDVSQLGEVVVTAMGIERQKSTIGYAIGDVKSDQLNKGAEANVIDALSGKVSGIQVTSSSGSPGAASSITVRGGKQSPLFVVDGVPVINSGGATSLGGYEGSNRIIDMNPQDISSVTVLKGQSAAALYGSLGQFGAIIITTKKGKLNSKPTITYSSGFAMDRVSQLPEKQNRYSQGVGGVYSSTSNRSWGARIDTLRYDGVPTPLSAQGSIVGRNDPTATGAEVLPFDNYDKFFQTGLTFTNNLSFASGGEKSSFYASLSHSQQTGTIPNSEFERTTFKLTSESYLTEKLKVTASASYTKSEATRIRKGSTTGGAMLGLFRAPATFDLTNGASDPANDPSSYLIGVTGQRSFTDIYDNPYYSVNKNLSKDAVDRIFTYGLAEYDFTDWLSLSLRSGIDVSVENLESLTGFYSAASETNGDIYDRQSINRSANTDIILKFNKQFGQDFAVTFYAGWNARSSSLENISISGSNFVIPDFEHISNAPGTRDLNKNLVRRRKSNSLYFDGQVGWKNMIYLNVTGRNDWFSTLPVDNNSIFYPSVSATFLTHEMWSGMPELLSTLTFRASYAETGNDDNVTFLTNTVYVDRGAGDFATGTTQQSPYNGQLAFLPSTLIPDPNLKAEHGYSYEFGVVLGAMDDRISIDATYFNATDEDQIVRRDLSPASGYRSRNVNAGVLNRYGVEIELGLDLIRASNFNWSLGASFTTYKTEVVSLGLSEEELNTNPDVPNGIRRSGLASAQTWWVEGEPINVILGASYQKDPETGRDLVDSNGYPILNANPTIIGDPNPDWLMGITNTLSYKNLTLTALIDIRQGSDVWNGTRAVMTSLGIAKSTENRDETIVWDGVHENGTENTTPILNDETLNRIGGTGIVATASEFIEDGSWIRLRDVVLDYSLPASLMKKLPFESLNLSVGATNLILITDYSGVDPETNLQGASNQSVGLDYFNNPNTKTYRASLKVKF